MQEVVMGDGRVDIGDTIQILGRWCGRLRFSIDIKQIVWVWWFNISTVPSVTDQWLFLRAKEYVYM